MASIFTPNIQLEEPARGDDVGTWDTPVNSNMTLIDKVTGGTVSIALNNSPVVLSAAQFQAKTIVFNSTLTGSVLITFPTSFTKSYEIFNLCTGSSAFTITMGTTSGGVVIAAPPGEIANIANITGSMFYANLGRIGAYWDYAGSSVPNWVSACTVPPFLNCDGTTFSAATYPALAVVLGSTTLPDSKGRSRFALDQGAARLSSAIAGFSPNTVGSAGGSQSLQQHSHTISITDPGHTHGHNAQLNATNVGAATGGGFNTTSAASATINSAVTNITAASSNTGAGTAQNIPPAYIGGLTLIRAA